MARRYLRAIFHFNVEKIISFPEQQVQQELFQPVQLQEQQEPAWKLPDPEPEQQEQQQEPEPVPELLLFSCSQLRKQEPW
jgi:hypothetical protein